MSDSATLFQWLDDARRDVRDAIPTLRKTPRFAIVAVASPSRLSCPPLIDEIQFLLERRPRCSGRVPKFDQDVGCRVERRPVGHPSRIGITGLGELNPHG